MRRSQPPRPELDDDGDDAAPTPGPTPFDWARLVVHAALRRKAIATLVLLCGIAATTAYFVVKKPVYQVETKILTQRQLGPASVRGGYDNDLPTRSAWEFVHRRENLVALVRAAKILPGDAGVKTERKPGLTQRLAALAGREVSVATEDPEDVLVTVLDKRLTVGVEDNTITISLIWPDPQQAYDVVQAALQSFLDARYVQEVRAAEEVISVVQARAAALRAEYEAASDDARRRSHRPVRTSSVSRPRAPSEELSRLHAVLESKQRALADIEEFRRRRVADLQAQLDQARTSLSEAHPKVVSLRRDIETAARETPQVEALREEERAARKAYSAQLAKETPSGASATAEVPSIEVNAGHDDEDPRVRQLRIEAEQMSIRVSAAQIELDAGRAAFKYRYNVVWPPQLPTEPVSPNPKKIFPAGLVASLLLALLVASAPDLLRGRILEPWQIERQLQVPILGRIDEP